MKETRIIKSVSCRACGGKHETIEVTKYTLSDADGWNWYYHCPINEEPVQVRIHERKNGVRKGKML